MAESSVFEANLNKFTINQTIKKDNTRTKYHIQTTTTYMGGETEEDAKIIRVTIGEKNPLKPNKTILLVGETGAGKSTFIDAMLTHVMGVTYEDNAWCTMIREKKEEVKKSESQTKAITIYEIFELANENFPCSLTIIDTPGFGDTEGVDKDLTISTDLEHMISAVDGIKELDAVGLVLKDSTNRLTDRQSYIFNSILSLFGKNLEKNITALITYSGGGKPVTALETLEKANIKIAKNDKKPMYFLFNNQNVAEKDEDNERAQSYAWDTSNAGLKKFLDFLKAVRPQDLKQTAEVLLKRNQTLACYNVLKERIEFIELQEKRSNQLKKGVEKLDYEAENAVMDIEVDEPYKELEAIVRRWDNKATRCEKCEENCHYPNCTTARGPKWCEVMKNEKCTVCTKKCHHSEHVKDKQKYVSKTRKVTMKEKDYKKKYEIVGKKGKKERLLASIQSDLDGKRKEKINMIDQIYQCICNLEEIAMESNAIATYIHLDFVIECIKNEEKRKEKGNGAETTKLNDERVRKLTEIKKRIQHKEGTKGIKFYNNFITTIQMLEASEACQISF